MERIWSALMRASANSACFIQYLQLSLYKTGKCKTIPAAMMVG
jgi:hypothetical protein